jgi:hypothetical protein
MSERGTEITIESGPVGAAAPTAAGSAGDDDAVREKVRALLDWGRDELDLLASAFRGCSEEQLAQVVVAQHADALPAAYHEFLRRAGQGGIGSAVAEIFPGDDVDYDSILSAEDWVGMRALAQEITEDAAADLDLTGHAVIRVHRLAAFEYVTTTVPDPPVWCFDETTAAPRQEEPTFTAWLERRIGRAIKRRYPLRDAHFRG